MMHLAFVSATMLLLWISGQAPTSSGARPCPGCGIAPEPIDSKDVTGWTQIFDGKTLDGWDGNPDVWKAENGAITAESTADSPSRHDLPDLARRRTCGLRIEARDQGGRRHS